MTVTNCFRVACLLMPAVAMVSSFAQPSLKLPLNPAGVIAFNEHTKPGYTALGKIHVEKDFDKQMAMFAALVAENKDFAISSRGNTNVVFAIGDALKRIIPIPRRSPQIWD